MTSLRVRFCRRQTITVILLETQKPRVSAPATCPKTAQIDARGWLHPSG
jgi:hypothetical protein